MAAMTKELRARRIKRRKKTAEIMTPPSLVKEMVDMVGKCSKNSIWQEDNTFLDPCCGHGNFLIEILNRKLNLGHDSFEALKTIHGLDIMQDTIIECRLRLLKVVDLYGIITKEHIFILYNNIKWLDTNIWKNGSLDYDMSFMINVKELETIIKEVDNLYSLIQNGELDKVDISDFDF